MKQTEAQLADRLWWWRKLPPLAEFAEMYNKGENVDSFTLHFYTDFERAALLYELGKRVNGKYELKKPFNKLAEDYQWALSFRWPMPRHELGGVFSIRKEQMPVDWKERHKEKEGWTSYADLSWNLKYPDATLARAFLKAIRSERDRLGIPSPAPTKIRRRPFSWRVVELLDIEREKLRPLNSSERSRTSQAPDKYRRVYQNRSVIRVGFSEERI